MKPILYAKLFSLLLLVGAHPLFAQPGSDGPLTVAAPNTVVNAYAPLLSTATAGTFALNVNVASLNNGTALATGDLVLIIGMQGADINTNNTAAYGGVTAYNSAGLYEFGWVSCTNGASTVLLTSPLANTFVVGGRNRVQVVRVPLYTNLTVGAGNSITAPAWNGTTGGLIAIHASGTITVNGAISANGLGFRGGIRDNNTSPQGATVYADFFNPSDALGGEKGESIAGFITDYDALGGRYCRGAAANGGGGGNAHNAGGGGGANGNNGTPWNGLGNPDLSGGAPWIAAWNLEGGTFSGNTSSGGGRGGYTFGSNDANAATDGPGDAAWGGDNRDNTGGWGGRPLDAVAENRIFFGGGGGAGDGNNTASNDGGDGGGIVYLFAANITGTGSITANGQTALNTIGGGNDAPGGGGGGGSIVVKGAVANTLTLNANGGAGGNQIIGTSESEGPGGGGGGGFVAIASGAPTINVNGGANGTSNSGAVTEFIPNGATRGGSGLSTSVSTSFPTFTDYVINSITATPDPVGQNATLTLTVANAGAGATYNWSGNGVVNANAENTTAVPTVLGVQTYAITVTLVNGCARPASRNVTVIVLAEDCTNGIDDDADGLTDCADPDCGVSINSVSSANPTCATDPALNDGQISVTASGANLEYSINGGTSYQALGTFSGLTAGSYTVQVRNSVSGCITLNGGNPVVLSNPVACVEICFDGIDNDGNGLTDGADPDCQNAFPCDRRFFLTTSSVANSEVYRYDPVNNITLPLGTITGRDLNSAGYDPLDNFIYALDITNGRVYRVRNDLTVVDLGAPTPAFTGTFNVDYQGGCFLNNGTYVVGGRRLAAIDVNTSPPTLLADVPLTWGTNPFGLVGALTANLPVPGTLVADFAAPPSGGQFIFAYTNSVGPASAQRRLVRINADRTSPSFGEVTFVNPAAPQPTSPTSFIAAYFTPSGLFYGYGPSNIVGNPNDFVVASLGTGLLFDIGNGPVASRADGTNCPFSVELFKSASLDTVSEGGIFTYTFQVVNASANAITGATISDVLPGGIVLAADIAAPFGGTVSAGGLTGNNSFTLSNLTLPIGSSVFSISVQAPLTNVILVTNNQANLSDLPPALGGSLVSDNPNTPLFDDPTRVVVLPDNDGDDEPDLSDIDDDNDGVTDVEEVCGAGAATFVCAANPGSADPSLDADGDGIPNAFDADYCTLNGNGACASLDADGDGVPNLYDLDSDNDGIADVTENGGPDPDGNGVVGSGPSAALADSDNDGLADIADPTTGGTAINLLNFDGDGAANAYDLDADDDGILDVVESGSSLIDANGDGQVDGADTDGDGIVDVTNLDAPGSSDFGGTFVVATNTDGISGPDYLDIDADNDGIVDIVEGQATATYVAPTNSDSDNDGVDDAYDAIVGFGAAGNAPVNTDGQDLPDYLDLNTDNDLQTDAVEGWDTDGDNIANIGPGGADADNDGLDDDYDQNTASPEPTNGTTPVSYPNLDNAATLQPDWREVTVEICDDLFGLDEDGDGLVNCADTDCQRTIDLSYTPNGCTNGANLSPTLTVTPAATGGTYTATPAGLAVNPVTGIIDVATSTPGTYQVTYSITATPTQCSFSDTFTVTITAPPGIPGPIQRN